MRSLTDGICIELLRFDQNSLSHHQILREGLLMIVCAPVTDPSVGGRPVRHELVSIGNYPFFVFGEASERLRAVTEFLDVF